MDPVLAPYAERARAKMTPEAFLAAIAERRAAYDGLLDDEALALLVLDEAGLNDEAYVRLREAASRGEASVEVRVAGPPSTRQFTRRDGGAGEVTNVPIEDGTTRATLVFWGRDAEKAAGLAAGQVVRVVNARVKETKFGLELHASPWTVIEVPGALSPARAKLLADVAPEAGPGAAGGREPDTLEGVLVRLSPTRSSFADGKLRFEADLTLRTVDGERTVTLVDEPVRAARALAAGARVRVTALAHDGRRATTTAASRIDPA